MKNIVVATGLVMILAFLMGLMMGSFLFLNGKPVLIEDGIYEVLVVSGSPHPKSGFVVLVINEEGKITKSPPDYRLIPAKFFKSSDLDILIKSSVFYSTAERRTVEVSTFNKVRTAVVKKN